jgi:Zn-dependent peptidase ImmA (M78 family)/DNA-binding XRE family transcriptional regulator
MQVGTPSFVGARLKEAREARGISCRELSENLGIARSSVSNYENGRQTPSPTVLQAMSQALSLPTHFFTRKLPPREVATQFFRSYHSATKLSRTSATQKYEWFREIASFLHQFVKFPDLQLPEFGPRVYSEELALEEIEELAAETRAYWQLADRPISNMVWLLENKGIVCCRYSFNSSSLDGFSEWRRSRPFIALAADKNCCVRSRYDAAHELAHMVLHRSLSHETLGEYSRFSAIERQADRFAVAFLLPASSFADEFAPSLEVLRELKRKWRVSIAAMVMRGRDLKLLSEDDEQRLWRQIGRRKWRIREPLDDVLPPEEPEFIRRSIRLLEERGISSSRDIAFQLGLSEADVVTLCGIASHTVESSIRHRVDQDGPTDGCIIPFRQTNYS